MLKVFKNMLLAVFFDFLLTSRYRLIMTARAFLWRNIYGVF